MKYIPQAEIKITDVWPNHGKSIYVGLTKQEKFLFDYYSFPMPCPCCGSLHTGNELYINHPDFKPAIRHIEFDYYICPTTGEKIQIKTALLGGELFISKI